jgi:hypothetical protein
MAAGTADTGNIGAAAAAEPPSSYGGDDADVAGFYAPFYADLGAGRDQPATAAELLRAPLNLPGSSSSSSTDGTASSQDALSAGVDDDDAGGAPAGSGLTRMSGADRSEALETLRQLRVRFSLRVTRQITHVTHLAVLWQLPTAFGVCF